MRFGTIAIATLIAFVVSVICLLPPGIHFVSGPIGPFIGGYVVGSRFRLNSDEAGIVGLFMGIALGAVVTLSLSTFSFMPDLPWKASIPLGVVGAVYVGLLGGLGAWLSGRNR